MIANSLMAMLAKQMRSTVAAMMPTRIARARRALGKPGRRQPDDHRIVAGQHQVDHDDLEEGGDRSLRE